MPENSRQTDALIEELLSMNRTETVFQSPSPSPQETEQRTAKRRRIRQELVAALSVDYR